MPISEKEADEIFKLCDSNGDGNVTRLELLKGLNAYFKKSLTVDDIAVSLRITTYSTH
jgi:Ca2+-binding EF-hand superfamily protein